MNGASYRATTSAAFLLLSVCALAACEEKSGMETATVDMSAPPSRAEPSNGFDRKQAAQAIEAWAQNTIIRGARSGGCYPTFQVESVSITDSQVTPPNALAVANITLQALADTPELSHRDMSCVPLTSSGNGWREGERVAFQRTFTLTQWQSGWQVSGLQ